MSDLDGKCFIRTERGLVPADIHADEWLGTLPFKREVIITSRQPRSPEHHRWFFAMLKKVLDNTDNRWSSVEELRDALKIATGYFEVKMDMAGEYYRVPRSMSYASMKGDEFKRFVDACLYHIQLHTGIDPVELMREVDAEEGVRT
jgi:hypothetical protein